MPSPAQEAGDLLEAGGLDPLGQAELTAHRRSLGVILDPMAQRQDPLIPRLARFNSLPREDFCEAWLEVLWVDFWDLCFSGALDLGTPGLASVAVSEFLRSSSEQLCCLGSTGTLRVGAG